MIVFSSFTGGLWIFFIFSSQQDIRSLYFDFFRSIPSRLRTLVRCRSSSTSSQTSDDTHLNTSYHLPRLGHPTDFASGPVHVLNSLDSQSSKSSIWHSCPATIKGTRSEESDTETRRKVVEIKRSWRTVFLRDTTRRIPCENQVRVSVETTVVKD